MKPSIRPLVKKEVISSLNSAAAYLSALFFLILGALWYLRIHNFAARDYASFREYFSIFPLLFIILIPALTMRVWAEERRSGTDELLLTMPYTPGQLVIGKFLGAYAIFLTIILLTVPMILLLVRMGDFDPGQILTQYIGVLLLGAASISLGIFISALVNNQISAFLVTVTALLLLTVVFDAARWSASLPGWLASFLRYFSVNAHFESFARGVIDTRDLAFFLIGSSVFMYANRLSLEIRKWS
jgi:ABC-2 type transport system permease protein